MKRREFLTHASIGGSVGLVGLSAFVDDAVANGPLRDREMKLALFSKHVGDKFVARIDSRFIVRESKQAPDVPAERSADAPARKWTDATGKHTVVASLLAVEADNVRLKRSNGKLITMPLSKLSTSDRKHLERIAEKQETAEDLPAGDQPTDKALPNDKARPTVNSRGVLTLKEAKATPLSKGDVRREGKALRINGILIRNEPFTLLFTAPLGTRLGQGTYRFEHGDLGEFSLFIVPISARKESKPSFEYYVATFN